MTINNTKISFPTIVNTIKTEISTLATEIKNGTDAFSLELQNYVSGLAIFVDDEQSFIKITNVQDNGVYVVVKFGSASTNFGSSICPVTLTIFGTKNKIKPAQMFFSAFCSRWSLQNFGDSTSTQLWVTPQVSANFNDVTDGFRTLFNISGTLVIGQKTVKLGTLTYKYGNNTETIDFLSYQDNFSNSLAPQPFGNTCGFAVSESNFSTFTFSISTYLLDCQLVKDCMELKGFRKLPSAVGATSRIASTITPNKDFELFLEFTNGYTNKPLSGETASNTDPVLGKDMFTKFKCTSATIGQKIGDIPTITLAFTL